MNTLAIIPARLGATRLSEKPLRRLADVPLVVRVWERSRRIAGINECVIATDHANVMRAATDAGATAVMTSASHLSGTERVAEVAAMPSYSEYDAILNVQGDEPFIPVEAVTGALAQLEKRFPIGTAAARATPEILDRPDVVKVVVGDDGRALYFSRAPIPYLRDAGDAVFLEGLVLQHVGVYAYTREALQRWVALPQHPLEKIERLEQLRPLAAGIPIGVAIIETAGFGGIDTEDDLVRANAYWNELHGGGDRP